MLFSVSVCSCRFFMHFSYLHHVSSSHYYYYYYLNVAWRLRLCRSDASFFSPFFQHPHPILGSSVSNYIQIEFTELRMLKVCNLPSVNKLLYYVLQTRSPFTDGFFSSCLAVVLLLFSSWLIEGGGTEEKTKR